MRKETLQWMSGLAGWLGLACCLCLLLAAADRGACEGPITGFGIGTTVSITLDQTSIYRDMWEAAYGRYMGSTIAVTQHGLEQQNEIKLYGRRDGTLWPDEQYWSMDMEKIYFTYSQTSGRHTFDFGPPCPYPGNSPWNQIYKYTATIFAGNTYTSGSTYLTVINEWDGGMGLSIIDETL